jgi:hypothetical protein
MEDLLVFVAAIILIVLGARGTYTGIWNKIFPNMPLTGGTPTQLPTSIDLLQGAGDAATAGANSFTQGVGNAAAAGAGAVKSILPGTNTTSNQAHVVPSNTATGTVKTSSGKTVVTGGSVNPVESIGTTKQAVLSTGVPGWWPSWLPYPGWFPHPGQGQTGQFVNNPWAP